MAKCPHCGLPPDEKQAPVQGFQPGIPWSMHLRAYDAYCKRYGPQPALIQGWCRGGFGTGELDIFIPGWREELSVLAQLKAEVAELRSWKESSLEVEAEWDPQAVAKALGIGAGKSIRANILPEIEKLKSRLEKNHG